MPPKTVKKGKGKQTEEKKVEKKPDPTPLSPSVEEPPLPNPPPQLNSWNTQELDQAPIPVPPPTVQQKHAAFGQNESATVDHFGLSSYDMGKPDEGGWRGNDGVGEDGSQGDNTGWGDTGGTDTSELGYTDDGEEIEPVGISGPPNEKPPAIVQARPITIHSAQPNAPPPGPHPLTAKQPNQIHAQSGAQAQHQHSASASKGNKAPHKTQSARTSTTSMPKSGARPALATTQARGAHSSYFWTPNEAARAQPSTTPAAPKSFTQPLSAWGEPKNVDPWGSPKPQPKQPPPAATSKSRPAWQDWGREVRPRPAQITQGAARGHHPRSAWSPTFYNEEEEEYSEDEADGGDPRWEQAPHSHSNWRRGPRKPKVTFAPAGSNHGVSTGDKPVLTPQEHSQILRSLLNELPQSQPSHFQHQRHPQTPAPHQPGGYSEQLQHQFHSRSLLQPHQPHNPHDGTWRKGRQTGESWGAETPQTGDYGGWHDNSEDGWNRMAQGYALNQNSEWENNRHGNKPRKGISGGGKKAGGWDQIDGWGEHDGEEEEVQEWENIDKGGGHDNWGYENSHGNKGWEENNGRRNANGWDEGEDDGWDKGDGWGKGDSRGKDDGWGRTGLRVKGDSRRKEDRRRRENDLDGNDWGQVDTWGKNDSSGQNDNWGQSDSWGRKDDPGQDDKVNINNNSWGDNDNSGQDAAWVQGDGLGKDDSWTVKRDDWGKNNTWGDEAEEGENDEWETSPRYHYVSPSEGNAEQEAGGEKPTKKLFTALKETYWKPTSAKNKNAEPENTKFLESQLTALSSVYHAIFTGQRKARDRIHWIYSPDKDDRVSDVLRWVKANEFGLGSLGLQKFLLTRERGALFINATFHLEKHSNQPFVDWLTFSQLQQTTDRIIQESPLTCDPASQSVVFVFLPSTTKNSVAMWRRKVPVPDSARLRYKDEIQFVKEYYLKPDKDYVVHIDEKLPPKKKGKKAPRVLSSKQTGKQKAKEVPAKPVLVKHQRSQSLSNTATVEKKRKWWQRLRFDI